jgi:hypothetical protein
VKSEVNVFDDDFTKILFIVGEEHNICTTRTAGQLLVLLKVATVLDKTFSREVDGPWLAQRV